MRARDFRQQAWTALSGKWGTMVLIGIIVSAITSLCGGLSWMGVGAVALLLITGPLNLGVATAFLKVVRGKNAEINDAFGGFKNFGNSFLLSLLMEIFIALWSLLFIIPGIIASYSYSMSYYILSDNPTMDGNTARKRSIEMMRGNKWRLFCLDCSFIGWYLLSILTFGILLFWVIPYHQTAYAEFYQNLLEEQNANLGGIRPGVSAFGTGYKPDEVKPESGKTFEGAEKSEPTEGVDNGSNDGDNGNNGNNGSDGNDGDNGDAPINADDL